MVEKLNYWLTLYYEGTFDMREMLIMGKTFDLWVHFFLNYAKNF